MNKKVIIGFIAIIVIALGFGGYFLLNRETNETERNSTNSPDVNENNEVNNNKNNELEEDTISTSNGKTLVVYYSATGSTKKVAEQLAEKLNADLFEIEPVDIYTRDDLNYSNSDSRVSREHDDESLRNVPLKNTSVDNWENYDTVLIGYPIWWGVAAWSVDTFVTANNFDGKTVIPFCTSASSGIGQSGVLLSEKANGGNWLEGHRFSSRPSDINAFIDSIQ